MRTLIVTSAVLAALKLLAPTASGPERPMRRPKKMGPRD